ncbi:hypothetical protein DDW08_04215 [Vulcanisaeta sp. SCGC AB-777_J10]|nr:hypothetical protein DDW08_04215 [Vulcanisaeta sp. SCGC AB-777_J10]
MIIALLVMLPTLTHAQIVINYISISIYSNNQTFTQLINITNNQLIIPIYQFCSGGGNMDFIAYLDPFSNLGITSVSLVLYNGTFITVPVNYSPKYVSMNINCSLPVYGVYLGLGGYQPYPPEALVIPGSNMTYTLTQGSQNITIPTVPGFNYLFSLIRIISILPASVSIGSYLTVPINTEYSSINIGSISTYARITTYVTYSSNIQVTANGTTYVIVTPYYYVPINNLQNMILPATSQPMIMLTGAPWISYLISNCTVINPGIPEITPWTEYLLYDPKCTVNMSIKQITISFVGESLQELQCNNVFLVTQDGATMNLVSNVTINPIYNRELYLVINGMKTIPIILSSIPTQSITIHVPLITRRDISTKDLLGNSVNTVLYINDNGTLTLFTNNTCIYPGDYDVYALMNGELMNLGIESITQGSSLSIPVFLNYTINVVLPQECPGLNLELVVKYGDERYVTPLLGSNEQVSIKDALAGNYAQVELLGNGTLLYQYALLINNGSSNEATITLSPHIINFVPIDLLGSELPTAVLNVGNLYYVGPGKYCVPTNSTVGMVIYGNDIYIVNVTKNNLYVRIWTLGPLGIKTLLIIFVLLTLLVLIMGILRGLEGGKDGSGDYVIIK